MCLLKANHSKKETNVLISIFLTQIADDLLKAKCAATLKSI